MTQISYTKSASPIHLLLNLLQNGGKLTVGEKLLIHVALKLCGEKQKCLNFKALVDALAMSAILPFQLSKIKKDSKYQLTHTTYYKSLSLVFNKLIKKLKKTTKQSFKTGLTNEFMSCMYSTSFLFAEKKAILKKLRSLTENDIKPTKAPNVSLQNIIAKKNNLKITIKYKNKESLVPQYIINNIQHNHNTENTIVLSTKIKFYLL